MAVKSVPIPSPPGGGVSPGASRWSAAPADDGPAFWTSSATRTIAPIRAAIATRPIVLALGRLLPARRRQAGRGEAGRADPTPRGPLDRRHGRLRPEARAPRRGASARRGRARPPRARLPAAGARDRRSDLLQALRQSAGAGCGLRWAV